MTVILPKDFIWYTLYIIRSRVVAKWMSYCVTNNEIKWENAKYCNIQPLKINFETVSLKDYFQFSAFFRNINFLTHTKLVSQWGWSKSKWWSAGIEKKIGFDWTGVILKFFRSWNHCIRSRWRISIIHIPFLFE